MLIRRTAIYFSDIAQGNIYSSTNTFPPPTRKKYFFLKNFVLDEGGHVASSDLQRDAVFNS